MPYIKQEIREMFDIDIGRLTNSIHTDGEMNYVITKLLDNCYGGSYTSYNEAIGILECAKLEFYRRAVATYEDKKIVENGDVYAKR